MVLRASLSSLALVLTLSCAGKPAKDAERPLPIAAAPDPVAPDTPACRTGSELRSWLAAAWKIQPAQHVDSASCAAGAFPEPGFAISGWITPKDGEDDTPELFDYRLQILDASGAVLADFADPDADDPRLWLNGSTPAVQVADLDGDGVAELITTEDEIGREDSESSSLTVYQRRGAALVEAGTLITRTIDPGLADGGDPDDPDNPYGLDCSATVTIAPGGITLVWTTREGAEVSGTCPSGTQVFALRDGALFLE